MLRALKAAVPARVAANRQQYLEDGDYEAGYAAGRRRSLLATSDPRANHNVMLPGLTGESRDRSRGLHVDV
jgi:hypothetical protein